MDGLDLQKTVLEVLKKLELFRNLSGDYLVQIASSCIRRPLPKGAVLFYQTEMSSDLFIILSGKVKATLTGYDGNELVLCSFSEGDFFGEMNLFDNQGRSATATAETDCEMAVLEREKFIGLLMKKPKIAVELITILSKRLRKTNEMVESLVFLDVRERLLKEFSRMAGPDGAAGKVLKIDKKTHQELACRIGASREAVSKCMKAFIHEGVIDEKKDHFLVNLPKGKPRCPKI